MKKSVVVAVFVLFMLQSVAALSVTTQDKGSVIIKELGNPAVFNFNILSDGVDNAEIYTFLGFTVSPHGNFDLLQGNNAVEVKFYPLQSVLSNNGYYIFEYQIKSQNTGIYKGDITVKLVGLGDVLSINTDPIATTDSVATLHVQNTQNAYIENAILEYSSQFFKGSAVLTLNPFEEKTFNITIDPNSRTGVRAGQYLVTGNVKIGDASASIQGPLEYAKQERVDTKTDKSGFLVRTTKITKTNTGNVDSLSQIQVSKDILSRLFTSLATAPKSTERSGLGVMYTWERTLAPGESYSISVTTNYTFPFIVLIIIVAIVVLVKMYQNTNVVVKKTVSFVKTKGGEFALKITLHVRANKQADNLQLIDPLPPSLKLYESYGKRPDKIDAATRRLTWNIGSLGAGEERVFSYIAYSKIQVVGRFELPSALAVFSHNNETQEVNSNRAFFVSEMTSSE